MESTVDLFTVLYDMLHLLRKKKYVIQVELIQFNTFEDTPDILQIFLYPRNEGLLLHSFTAE